jgi:hypothetical protein
LFDAGRIQREHLHVNARGIHRGDAAFVHVLELLDQPPAPGTGGAALLNESPARPDHESRACEMLLERDGPQFGFRACRRRLAAALSDRLGRHRGRSRAGRCSVDEVAAIHGIPPGLKALREFAEM